MSSGSRAKVLAFATVLLAAALPVASAGAIVANSDITTPSSTSFPLNNENESHGGATSITVAGTATGISSADIRCFSGEEQSGIPVEGAILAEEVPVVDGTFSVAIQRSLLPETLCRLRALPHEDEEIFQPAVAAPFEGPLLSPSRFRSEADHYEAIVDTPAATLELTNAEYCALESSLFTATFKETGRLFYCDARLDDQTSEASLHPTLDGVPVYGPKAAHEIKAGGPEITVRPHFDESTGAVTVEEEDPLVECSPEPLVLPATGSSCSSFTPTGVTLKRTWASSDEGHVARLTDTWESSGGAHLIAYHYFTELDGAEVLPGGVFEFPGSGSFVPTTSGQSVTLPSGPGAILYKADATTPEAGDGLHPQGAIVYDRAPDGPLLVKTGSELAEYNVEEMPYQRTIPAGGSTTLRMTFIQSLSMNEVRTDAEEAIAGYYPSLSIGSPASGTTVSTPSVTVTGTASDSGQLASVTVNGESVTTSGRLDGERPAEPGRQRDHGDGDRRRRPHEEPIDHRHLHPPARQTRARDRRGGRCRQRRGRPRDRHAVLQGRRRNDLPDPIWR